ncbi:MAG TPA: hypothetical protein VKG84_10715 [Candidatus Acidoferrales bacterium]|nr:hypothetical protein [Candidatus Acidoferrales bacterium]
MAREMLNVMQPMRAKEKNHREDFKMAKKALKKGKKLAGAKTLKGVSSTRPGGLSAS